MNWTRAIGATMIVAAPIVAAGQPPSLSVQLNGNAFRPGDVMELRVSLLPGAQPASSDAYVVLQTPDQSYMSLQLGGALVTGVVPIVQGLTPVSLSTPMFAITIPAGTPPGNYRWLAAVTQAGSMNIHDGIGEVRFRIGTSPSAKVFTGLNFAPWMFDQNPEHGATASVTQITARLATLAPWTTWVKLFGTGGGLDHAPAIARSLGLLVACGAWLNGDDASNNQELTALENLGSGGLCDMLIVGSETLFRNELTAAKLVAYITRVKAAVPGVTVTTSDTYGTLLNAQNASVLDAVDLVMYTAYPYWEGVSPAQAPAYLASRHAELVARAPGKRVVVGETGWPTCGNTIGSAVPSPGNAAQYASAVLAWSRTSHVEMFYFTGFDENWKATPDRPQEACWGVWDRLGNAKPSMLPLLFQ